MSRTFHVSIRHSFSFIFLVTHYTIHSTGFDFPSFFQSYASLEFSWRFLKFQEVAWRYLTFLDDSWNFKRSLDGTWIFKTLWNKIEMSALGGRLYVLVNHIARKKLKKCIRYTTEVRHFDWTNMFLPDVPDNYRRPVWVPRVRGTKFEMYIHMHGYIQYIKDRG